MSNPSEKNTKKAATKAAKNTKGSKKNATKNAAATSTVGKRHTTAGKAGAARTGVANPGLRRLARRAGVKRVSVDSFDQSRQMMDQFVNKVVRDAVIMSEAAGRKTVTTGDVSYSLKRNGHALFGY